MKKRERIDARVDNNDGWHLSYYVEMIDFLAQIGIALYEPHCFDMGVPPELFRRCKIVTNAAIQ